jgi:hypothetical protein
MTGIGCLTLIPGKICFLSAPHQLLGYLTQPFDKAMNWMDKRSDFDSARQESFFPPTESKAVKNQPTFFRPCTQGSFPPGINRVEVWIWLQNCTYFRPSSYKHIQPCKTLRLLMQRDLYLSLDQLQRLFLWIKCELEYWRMVMDRGMAESALLQGAGCPQKE